MYNNKQAFLLKKPHKLWLLVLLITVVITLLVYIMIRLRIYDNYQTKGYVTCNSDCFINVMIPSNITFDKISINSKNMEYIVLKKELKLDEENLISYFDLTIKTNLVLNDKEIINLNFYYNKQRIIKKIKEKIF
ncbi:MAG: hypothetical protein NC483_02615 [Ruminococcus sp.]|nr:hypothetical protein [Ruminococcus sp.]